MSMIIDGSNGGFFPSWTTATRPASPVTGQVGFNSTLGSHESYNGTSWQQLSNGPCFSAYLSTNQTFTVSTWTKVQLNAKNFDTNSNFDATTNYRFTPTVAGYYQFNAYMNGTGAVYMSFYKNGAQTMQVANSLGVPSGSIVLYMNGSTDYVELYLYCGTSQTITASLNYNSMSGALLRTA